MTNRNILFIYSAASLVTNTVRDYVEAFDRYSRHNYFHEAIEPGEKLHFSQNLELFDAVVVHYSANFQYSNFSSTELYKRLGNFKGPIVVFTQDDYDKTDSIKEGLTYLQPKIVYTVLPNATAAKIYPRSEFPHTTFLNCLTGYVPERLKDMSSRPMSARTIHIGYRGRYLPIWYGKLGVEKTQIAKQTKEALEDSELNVDVEWETNKRLYGNDWDEFVGNCKTMLATESGCNVFDFDGSIRESIIKHKDRDPNISDDQLYLKYVAEHEEKYAKTNQISPKMFEAVAMRTVLVMYEGEYSGIFSPDLHYVPLDKNAAELNKVRNILSFDKQLDAIAERAYKDIIESEKYSYERFINEFDTQIDKILVSPRSSAAEIMHKSATLPLTLRAYRDVLDYISYLRWGVGKSSSYMKEWGLSHLIRKVAELASRKFGLLARMGKSPSVKRGDQFKVNSDENQREPAA